MMRPSGSDNTSSKTAAREPAASKTSASKTSAKARQAWEPPALTKLAIGTETKSSSKNESGSELKTSGDQPKPEAPAAPATKLGFSFEWAFPLAARLEP
jgi:hypothetical protein